jgi:hypothetical protein
MYRWNNFCRSAVWMLLILLAAPTSAHTIKVSKDVAATFHIEPNHHPKSGELAYAWFALTRSGGTTIALSECNCQLVVRFQSQRTGDEPLLQPSLKPITKEQYREIPSAEIIFPQPGEYELELSGTAKDQAQFQPFEFSYTVTVTRGQSQAVAISSAKTKSSTSTPAAFWQVPLAIAVVGTLGLGLQRLRRKLPGSDFDSSVSNPPEKVKGKR